MKTTLTLNFRSLGLELKKAKGFPAVELEASPEDEPALAAIVSAQAEKLVPGLKGKNLRVRITTPDGRPWDLPTFYVEDRDTAARYGWGTASLRKDYGAPGAASRWKDFAPWSD